MSSYYKQQLNDWVATLDVKADRVLDIGGSQNPIKGRTKSWDVKDYKILDLAEPHVTKQKPDIVFDLQMDNLTDEARLPHWKNYIDKTDLIFCLEVFDYITDTTRAFENLAEMLQSGGVAWVTFPFVYPIHNPVVADGLRYTEPAIRQLAVASQLKAEEIIYRRPKPGNKHLLQFYAEDGMRAAQGVDHNVTGYICKLTK